MNLLSAHNISVTLGKKTVVQELSVSLKAGELIGLIGPNGAGKSTLLRALAGVKSISAGQLQLLDKPMHSYSAEQRARKLAWLAQSGPINWPLSVERLVALGRTPHQSSWQRPSHKDAEVIDRILQQTDCEQLRQRDATSLSGGERARVLLARALASEPEVLLADEPVAALDLAHQLHTMEHLRRFAQDSRACVVVLHELSLAARYCDRLLLMHNGQLVSSGEVSEVLTEHTLRTVYGVEAEIHSGEFPWVLPKRLV